MKAIVKKEAKAGIWMEEVSKPVPKDGEVLIKTRKTSICGTDVNIYKWGPWAQKNVPLSTIIGHEFMGEIAEVGSQVKGLKVGQRVSGEGHVTCGRCINCLEGDKHLCSNTLGVGIQRNGCFAEYFTLPAENVFILPDSVSDDLAAIFDPYGNAVHTASSFNLLGEDVLITGAGPIGIMSAAIAKLGGARNVVITDINEGRLALAKKMGATSAVNVAKTPLEPLENGFTVGFEMSGAPQGFNTLLENMRNGGRVALLGILPPDCQIDWDLVIFKMLTLKGIYGREIFSTWNKMVSLLEAGLNLDQIITHQFSADEYQLGFDAMLSGDSGKVILNW